MSNSVSSDMISNVSPNDVILECHWAMSEKVDKMLREEEGYTSDGTEVTSNTGPTKPHAATVETNKPKRKTTRSYKDSRIIRYCDAAGCNSIGTKCCSRCHTVYYCGPACQRAHWMFHKPNCTSSSSSIQQKKRTTQQTTTPKRLRPRERGSYYVCRSTTAAAPQEASSDEQSIGVRSKPSIIKVDNDVEEDFERFEEVDDDDGLSNSSSDLATPTATTIAPSSSSSMLSLTEERVRSHLRDYYEDFDSIFRLGKSSRAAWDSFFSQYFTSDIQWVRSSGNPLTGPELAEHFANDIVGIRMKLVEINSIQILMGTTAVVTFTADQKFEYRGNPNSDRTKITMVLVSNGREIRIAHEHRCAGKPIPEDSQDWDSLL